MIDKNVNIIKDPKIKRIVEYSADNKQINVLDQRFYRRNEEYYPSVSSILNYFPKNQFFHSWLKDVGHNSDIIASRAAAEGTQVHNAVEAFLNGNEINWLDEFGTVQYSKAWNETHDTPIEETGILWLKASTRGEGKGDAIQGKGWQLKTIGDIDRNFEMFLKVYDIYKLENPDSKPMTELLPTSVKLS